MKRKNGCNFLPKQRQIKKKARHITRLYNGIKPQHLTLSDSKLDKGILYFFM